jgi:hypothetical protein
MFIKTERRRYQRLRNETENNLIHVTDIRRSPIPDCDNENEN